MKKLIEKINLELFGLLVLSSVLRLFNLGYSDYQGDEIKALYLPDQNQSFANYFIDQRKGPIQFLITFGLRFLNPDYSNQLLMRTPFALAGILSVYFFYKFIQLHFGKRTALFSGLLLASNGFFVAFSRIVQYQSFVIFFMIFALYMFTVSVKDDRRKYSAFFWGFVLWALGILSHYDAVFIFPFAFYLVSVWVKRYLKNNVKAYRTLFAAFGVSALMLLSFYIPFILSISDSTLAYWGGRITGEVSTKISSSRYLFTVYQPIYVVHFYMLASILGFAFLYLKSYGLRPPRKVLFKKAASYISLVLWFVGAFAFMEGLVYIPGTHIYVYIVPLIVIISIGLDGMYQFLLEKFSGTVLAWAYQVIIFLVFALIFTQSYAVFVDNRQEYPWEPEKFLIWTFPEPTPIYHLSLFGFPYYRDWEGIGEFVKQYPEIKAYSTNERKSIARYYVPLEKDTDKAGFYIHIRNPQTFTEEASSAKSKYWMEKYDPIFTLTRYNQDYVRMYIMEPGSLDEIKKKGY
ncbi:MAG: hypothetical protein KatS3mg101_0617 [Patescibacteria group bacterium]|nr:MAG: hypothetical protein KatS3mg101_0617 [Patescibacteria group bacterium]